MESDDSVLAQHSVQFSIINKSRMFQVTYQAFWNVLYLELCRSSLLIWIGRMIKCAIKCFVRAYTGTRTKTNNLVFGPIRKLGPIFFKDFFLYTLSDKLDVLEVELKKIKTSFSTTRMQLLHHVTDQWA